MKFKVTTPMSVLWFTPTDWIDFGEDIARADVALAELIDPSGDYKFRLELVK